MSAPYITLNKLAEYMQANSTRRKQIVKSLKKDNDFQKIYYSEVKKVLSKYFKSNYEVSKIASVIRKIESKTAKSDWEKNDNANSILALKSLRDMQLPDLTNYELVTDIEKVNTIELSGVTVSIKPEIYLRNIETNRVGAIKFHLAKTANNRLSDSALTYAATLIKYGFIDYGVSENEIDDFACISVDIFHKQFCSAPKSYVRSLNALKAACEEIALWWDAI